MVRGKFTVSEITTYQYGSKKITLQALYDPNLPEDQKYAKATPSGTITMQVDNPPAADYLEIGKAFYVDFTRADETP